MLPVVLLRLRSIERSTAKASAHPPKTGPTSNPLFHQARPRQVHRNLIINRRHLMAVLTEYVAHFNHHRPHRALSQAAPLRSLPTPASPSQIHLRRRDLLDGLIYVPNRSSASGDLSIFVAQPTESVATSEVQVRR
jgi:hypothetical protein